MPDLERWNVAVHGMFDCLRTGRKSDLRMCVRATTGTELGRVQGKAASESLPERPRKFVKLVKHCQLQSGASDQVIQKLGSDLEMVVAFHQLSQLQVNCALLHLPSDYINVS